MEIIVKDQPRILKVRCNGCGKPMEVKREENPPYYCYKCEDSCG